MHPLPPLPEWVQLEHQVAKILTQQELHGWYFDEQAARELEQTLRKELEELTALLRNKFPFVAGALFTPKRTNRTQGYVDGAELQRLKDFNPSSRDQIAWIMQTHYGWTPSLTTSTGKPVIDETVLKDIGTDISLSFSKILELTKALGMISAGNNAWQKLCTTSSRIHHHCSVSTSTFRCAHRKPNLAQVPSGNRFRELFRATPELVMTGADLSGIELRLLSHYLARFDGGRYADVLINGDIHQENADKIGISRKQVKTVTYAFLYGAGNQRIGIAYDKQLSESAAKKKGKEIREAYVAAIPGLKELLEAVHKASERGYVRGLDDRHILCDSRHKSLNYLLQGSAAIIAKRWMVLAHEKKPKSAHQLAFIHDELQYECEPRDVDELKHTLENSAKQAGECYGLRVPIAAEAKAGGTWADVH
jgi:DNA polymerase I-like protein with 3'-5' exonuclease and polymerase domains